MLNELATNAAKHGALSSPDGSVDIRWAMDEDTLVLTWRERDGPAIAGPPLARGFGNVLARAGIEGQLGGTIAYDWQPEGLIVAIRLPMGVLSR